MMVGAVREPEVAMGTERTLIISHNKDPGKVWNMQHMEMRAHGDEGTWR